MIPIFTPATARKDVNKVPGDGELAKLANLNRLVENVNTIVANGIPASGPTLTYSNTGALDSMNVSFVVTVPSSNTQNSSGTKTVQSYYAANIDIYSNSPTLTSITFPDVISVNNISVQYIDLLTSISLPQAIYFYDITLSDLSSLTSVNIPSLSGNINYIELRYLPLLTSFNFSNIISIDSRSDYYTSSFLIQLSGLTSINFSSLAFLKQYKSFYITDNPDLTSFSSPELNICNNSINIEDNVSLTSITLGTIGTLKIVNDNISLSNNALNVGSVNGVLALLVSLDGTNGTSLFTSNLYLTGGTNAAPTGQGIIDVQTLIDRGCDVQTN